MLLELTNNHAHLRTRGAGALVFAKLASIFLALNVAAFIAIRFWNITAYSLSTDEIFSLLVVRHEFGSMLAYVVHDLVHPPLFYLLFKTWIKIGGESLLWVKLFPVLFSVVSLVPFFLLCRELRLRLSKINVALTLMAVNGYLVYFAQDVRMYSLLVFFTVCSIWLFVKFINAETSLKKNFVYLFIANLLLVHTHYFGWLVIVVEFTWVLFWARRRLPSISILVAALAVCFSPWVYAVTRAEMSGRGLISHLAWIERPDRYSLLEYYALLNGQIEFRWNTYLRLLLFGLPVLASIWRILKGRGLKRGGGVTTFWVLFFFSLMPIALCYYFSRILNQSVWHPRFLIIVAVPYLMLIAVAGWNLRPKWVRAVTVSFMLAWAVVGGFDEVTNRNISPRLSGHQVAWESLVHQMIGAESTQANNVKVYAKPWSVAVPMQFYLDSAKARQFELLEVTDDSCKPICGRTVNILAWDVGKEEFFPQGQEHFWVVLQEYQRKQVEEGLMKDGYQLGKAFEAGTRSNRIFLFPVWPGGASHLSSGPHLRWGKSQLLSSGTVHRRST